MRTALQGFLLFCICLATPGYAGDETPAAPLRLTYYYNPGCPQCAPVRAVLDRLRNRYPQQLHIRRQSLSESEEAFADYIGILDRWHIKTTPTQTVLVGDTLCLAGAERILDELEREVTTRLQAPGAPARPAAPPAEQADGAIDRVDLFLLSSAALIDGVNPCAFATIILFVSMLCLLERSRRELLAVGLAFLAGVYVTYWVIGFTFFKAMHLLAHLQGLQTAVLGSAFLLTALAAGLSLVDAFRARRSAGADLLLVLPEGLRTRIRKRLREAARAEHLVAVAAVSGVVIAFLESACTGQVYFPLILGLAKQGVPILRIAGLLAWYNFLFILPLLGVFLAVFWGIKSHRVAQWARRHLWLTKLALAAVFGALACWLGRQLLTDLIS